MFFQAKSSWSKKRLFNSISAAYRGFAAMEEIQDVLLISLT